MNKPRLTSAMAHKLIGLSVYAQAEADVISDGTKDQQEEAKRVREACDWISALARWQLRRERDRKPKEGK